MLVIDPVVLLQVTPLQSQQSEHKKSDQELTSDDWEFGFVLCASAIRALYSAVSIQQAGHR
jgi:hypothetical protein